MAFYECNPRTVNKSCPRNMVKQVPVAYTREQVPVAYTREQLKATFWRYDTNKDGKLSRKELKEAFDSLGAMIPGWRANRALNRADDNGDGYISEEEVDKLVKYAVKLGYTIK